MPGPLQSEIEQLLQHAFLPTRLDVINDSASHSGHTGDDGSGESHFTVVIESSDADEGPAGTAESVLGGPEATNDRTGA